MLLSPDPTRVGGKSEPNHREQSNVLDPMQKTEFGKEGSGSVGTGTSPDGGKTHKIGAQFVVSSFEHFLDTVTISQQFAL